MKNYAISKNIQKQEPRDELKQQRDKENNHQSMASSPAFFQFLFDLCAEVVVSY